MPKLVISERARADIKEISRYTQDRWGREQRIRYLEGFSVSLSGLLASRNIGKPRFEFGAGIRISLSGKHIIFFRRDDAGNIEVIRILHQSMDFSQHL